MSLLKMVGYDSKSSNLDSKDIAVAGALSGCITRATLQPIDVLKIRFQLQVEPISNHSVSKYRSIFQGFYTIWREEGFRALWKGHIPAQYLSITYGLVQFWVYETSSKTFDKKKMRLISDFCCGALAGSLATFVSFPFDITRTRLVAQNENLRVYKGMVDTFNSIVRNEGFFALYKGFLPAILQIAPHAGVQFMTFKFFERLYRKYVSESIEKRRDVLSSGVICGSFSGLFAKTAVYPFDLCRKRLQIQGFDRTVFGQNFVCNGLVDCVRQTYRFEGVVGLFKGLSPSLIKAVATGAMHFTTYDLICYEIAKFKKL